jgi:hypothetical protein
MSKLERLAQITLVGTIICTCVVPMVVCVSSYTVVMERHEMKYGK